MSEPIVKPFRLEFSNRVIEHLGIKLYQNKPTNVVAEFLSNSWDADATEVDIELKAAVSGGTPSIVINDNGRGMTRSELTDEFLVIGRNRRKDPNEKTNGGRLPMGRKGIGKLAGFGIAHTVDILSSPNNKLRIPKSDEPLKFYWLRFSLAELIKKSSSGQADAYEPEVIADGALLSEFKALPDASAAAYAKFIENAENGVGGVCVHLSNTTLKRAMNIDQLLESMGRRFTVATLRPDFVVKVNSKLITPELALPKLHNFSFGDWNAPIVEQVDINGVKREIKYLVKFVDLNASDWPLENAGTGIYTHGKIAQDRPFFFDIKGMEIWSRYIYGVIEADWLDELPNDVVSTDRRSIDWDTDETTAFHDWGAAKITFWISEFRKWRAEQPKKAIKERIRRVSPKSTLTGPEEDALAQLLDDILPSLGDNEEAMDTATKNFTEAWTHAPTRLLTKELWEKVFSSINSDSTVFTGLIENLRKSMVPEAMGLAVTMAQRVAAITVMKKMIENDKTETHLQRLIETFPWLLGPQWEKLTANQTIRTLVKNKHTPDVTAGEWSLDSGITLKPDFVFLSDVAGTKEFIVFELKGPEAGKTLQPNEYEQLREYLRIIRAVYPDRTITVKGVLVGHDKYGFEESDTRITVKTWSEVLLEARNMHVSYLQALLKASDPDADDVRLQQIADFGGPETMELLKRLAPIGEFPDVISESIEYLSLTEKKSLSSNLSALAITDKSDINRT